MNLKTIACGALALISLAPAASAYMAVDWYSSDLLPPVPSLLPCIQGRDYNGTHAAEGGAYADGTNVHAYADANALSGPGRDYSVRRGWCQPETGGAPQGLTPG